MNFKYLLRNIPIKRRIEIIHSLPGRLRLRISDLARLPEEYVQYLETLQTVLEGLPGVKSVFINHYSRNALFLYDPDLITEADLLAFIENIFQDSLVKAGNLSNGEDIHRTLLTIETQLKDRVEQIRTHHAAAQTS
ncbi:MAG: hypothetical protein ACLFV2_11675 [Desulfurivibrionaceae bacterium]